MKVEKTFCTTREAATLLGVSVGTTQLWVDHGLLSAWKTPGGHRRVARDSVEKLLYVRMQSVVSAPTEAESARMRVLVVEDDRNLLRLYQVMLAQWPMAPEVRTVDNGIEGLLAIEAAPPDLLIVDLSMPGVDGLQVLRILRSSARYAGIAIVAVSGLDETEIARRGGLPPGVTLLGKPVAFSRLLAVANSVEEGRRASVRLAA